MQWQMFESCLISFNLAPKRAILPSLLKNRSMHDQVNLNINLFIQAYIIHVNNNIGVAMVTEMVVSNMCTAY